MRRQLVELVASGVLAVALLVATIVTMALPGGGDGGEPPRRPAAWSGAAGTAQHGRTLFQAKGCVGCHTLAGMPGTAQVGPDLTALASVAGTRRPGLSAEAYVRESLL